MLYHSPRLPRQLVQANPNHDRKEVAGVDGSNERERVLGRAGTTGAELEA